MAKVTYSANIRPEWRKGNLGPTELSIFGYLVSCTRINHKTLEHRKSRGLPCGATDLDWRVVALDTASMNKTLTAEGKVKWSSPNIARVIISRAIKKLQKKEMICVVDKGSKLPGSKLVEVLWDDEERVFIDLHTLTPHKLRINSALTAHKQKVYAELTNNPVKTLSRAVESTLGKNNILQVSKEGNFSQNLSNIDEGNHKLSEVTDNPVSQTLEGIPQDETTTVAFSLTNLCRYGVITGKKCDNLIDSTEMKRSDKAIPFPDSIITRLEDFIMEQGERHVFDGGLDNDQINLAEWINNPLHAQLVAPGLNKKIPYDDVRDMPKTLKTFQTFRDFDWIPAVGSRQFNLLAFPGLEIAPEYALSHPEMLSQPFNNPYLSPMSKGLAFTRVWPFGWHTRDTWVHPWSPPVIPWAVCAHDEKLMKAWNEKHYHQGFHPFLQDKTKLSLQKAISAGNRELSDSIFDSARYDSLENKPNIAGAKTSIISDPASFQLLHWICGTFGISPSRMIEAYNVAMIYNGSFEGVDINNPKNENTDKVRIFLCWLKMYLWGDAKRGSWIPREGGVQKSLHASVGQEWSHQGVLGGYTVLVQCYDGQTREVFLNEYQKKVYDLKFNPQSDKDTEILDSLLAEMV